VRDVDVTAFLAPYPARRVRRPVRLRLVEETFGPEPTPEEAWLPIAFRAFARLADLTEVRDLLVLGTGNGLDVLGASEILPLRSVVATDLHASGVAAAEANVRVHLVGDAGPELTFVAGDLLEPVPDGRRFDLVYENLPNLPAGDADDLRRGETSGRFFAGDASDVPEPFGRYLLALHHRCLRDVRDRVRPGGGVLTAIGGRMPHEVVLDLHRSCGYEPELLAFDVKRQVEPAVVLPPYAAAEAGGDVAFTYYAADAIGLVAAARGAGLDGQELADAVAGPLAALAITATEAESRSRAGEDVAHSVLMVHGRRPA
jgi:hypothetical protein